ncbi:hypothetical protein Pan44_02550 [Caulifigura coniformis]|uniref:Uncharacterized protein n=1 Tax=Caulifigura coniformis TaxID=2527983 RepID=A0A517S802_9PLAN|nr:hypothetical protein [Caulifigura coniformis]QDT52246.1 hypothetical protein Pan44_02550 [Caulifigura coniformis]
MAKKYQPVDEANGLSKTWTPRFWERTDARSLARRTILSRRAELIEAIGEMSPQKELLVSQIVFYGLMLESLQIECIETGKFEPGVFTSLTNSLVGLLRMVGIEKQAKAVAGSLQDYLRERSA